LVFADGHPVAGCREPPPLLLLLFQLSCTYQNICAEQICAQTVRGEQNENWWCVGSGGGGVDCVWIASWKFDTRLSWEQTA
jgi:hypothetical protein